MLGNTRIAALSHRKYTRRARCFELTLYVRIVRYVGGTPRTDAGTGCAGGAAIVYGSYRTSARRAILYS